ncbi:MAG: PAS domain S-box protein, partial [Desulfobacterales bacterium]|nr:PAS domain S-box protein [Desulfobacterales bacterium]
MAGLDDQLHAAQRLCHHHHGLYAPRLEKSTGQRTERQREPAPEPGALPHRGRLQLRWIGPEGALRYVSPSCERITGYAVEEFVKDPDLLIDIVHAMDRKKIAEHLAKDLTGDQESDSLDFRITTRNGREIWINHNCQPVFANDGTFLGRRVGNRDITERKCIEANLQLHHERFLTVLDSIDAAIFVADLETYEILFVNKRHIQTFGQDLTGTRCWQSLRGQSAPCEDCRNPGLIGSDGEPTGVAVWH